MSKRKEDQEINYKKISKGEYELHVALYSFRFQSSPLQDSLFKRIAALMLKLESPLLLKLNIQKSKTILELKRHFGESISTSKKLLTTRTRLKTKDCLFQFIITAKFLQTLWWVVFNLISKEFTLKRIIQYNTFGQLFQILKNILPK